MNKKNTIEKNYGHKMIKWAKDLFPKCRSITGQGTKDTLNYLKKVNKELHFYRFKTGEKVFDWKIPKEWKIKDAYIEHESGKKYAEFSKNNLHILNYSIPINKKMKKKELLPNIYTQKNQPNSVPYVTSYYKERWGFCMSENQKKKLPEGKYRAYINSKLFSGELCLADALIKGKKKEEIFFSTYVCHPSMANNELSGPVLSSALLSYIKEKYKKTRYSYRFVFLPETIGSIAYIFKNLKILKSKIIAGFILSCVGDDRAYSKLSSRSGNALSDRALDAALIKKNNVKNYSYIDRGPDARQYCAPGIDLPVSGFCRSKYDQYPEYHTDADNFNVVTEKGLNGSFNVIKSIIDAFENGIYPQTKILGEPQLGKRKLYPTLSQKGTQSHFDCRMNLIAYADGKTDIFKIAQLINVPLEIVNSEVKILLKNKILQVK